MGIESAAGARRRAERCARRQVKAFVVMAMLPGCGELKQAAETTASGGDASGGAEETGSSPDDGNGLPPPGDDGGSASDASDDTPTTGEPNEDSSTGAPPPAGCGNARMDPGEQCDDGNTDDTDACTSLCAPPSCDDGIQSGAETGVDCGASCNGCLLDDACATSSDCIGGLVCGDGPACAWPPSCLSLLTAWPETETGMWPLDPDGDGQSQNFQCDMNPADAGWTRVLREDFTASDGAAWSQSMITMCGELGPMLGGSGVISGGTMSRPVELFAIPHTEARVRARYYKIDSWDLETAFAQIDGAEVWSEVYNHPDGPSNQCGGSWPEEEHGASGQAAHAGNAMTIAFGSNLDQGASNEAFGIGDVVVWVR